MRFVALGEKSRVYDRFGCALQAFTSVIIKRYKRVQNGAIRNRKH